MDLSTSGTVLRVSTARFWVCTWPSRGTRFKGRRNINKLHQCEQEGAWAKNRRSENKTPSQNKTGRNTGSEQNLWATDPSLDGCRT